jgi:hypothetical protein
MQDKVLLSVTQILDDSTGIWAGDLCEFSIHSADLEDFLKSHGEEGAKEICKTLDYLKKAVMEEYLPESKKEAKSKMKIKMSKSQWERIGKKAGWMKVAQHAKENSINEIIDSIRNKKNEYFSYSHFDTSNMSDYSMMSDTIGDLVAVYGIGEEQAAEIVQALTH